jgi:hypothetical protein
MCELLDSVSVVEFSAGTSNANFLTTYGKLIFQVNW